MKSICFIVTITALFLYACTPEGPDALSDYDTVITQHDPSFNFSNVRTYVLIDSVAQIIDSSDIKGNVKIPSNINKLILAQVAAQLNKVGWTPLGATFSDSGQKPDIVVQASAIATRNTIIYKNYYGSYWWNYWNWYPGWGYYYPDYSFGYYPHGVSYTNYTSGTISIDILNPKGASASTKRVPVVWSGALLGAAYKNNATLQQRITSGIQKAFQQSPYL